MFTETEAVAALETNIWSMMAQFGRVDPGRLRGLKHGAACRGLGVRLEGEDGKREDQE